MKNSLFLLFILSYTFCFAQNDFNYKAIYKLNYKTDSTSSFIDNEELVLLMNDNKNSFFQNYNTFKRDSINGSHAAILGSFIYEQIITNALHKKISINKTFQNIDVFYVENFPQEWVLKNTTSELKGIKCKEATLNTYGRKWTACYSEDYPFQFGPYFFAGLPGLILYIEDEQKYYQFSLVSIVKETNSLNKSFDVGKEISKTKFYQMEYETNFSGNSIEKNFSFFPADKKEQMKKKYIESAKRKNTLPIDKTMRYIFNK